KSSCSWLVETQWAGVRVNSPNKRLKRDCQRAAFPVPLSRGGFGCCV
ncbi:hypothetical protein GMD98_14405, partial [Vibrio cholerae O1 biovar El Tor]|nr:hypothetical protein [Vibrio cholerae O1 biovar El Tor]